MNESFVSQGLLPLLEPQSRFGGQTTWNLTGSSPKRDCGPNSSKRVKQSRNQDKSHQVSYRDGCNECQSLRRPCPPTHTSVHSGLIVVCLGTSPSPLSIFLGRCFLFCSINGPAGELRRLHGQIISVVRRRPLSAPERTHPLRFGARGEKVVVVLVRAIRVSY